VSESYDHKALVAWARDMFAAGGAEADKAQSVAEILVEGDLFGHDTHGLALLGGYLDSLVTKRDMTPSGMPDVLSERPAVALWDGKRLPGPWLVQRAIAEAATRAATYGTGTVVIRRSHHIACLAAYLKPVTDRGLVALVYSSDPAVAAVIPFGGTKPVITPNPMGIGIPTSGDPILVDISASITTMGMSNRYKREGKRMPGAWLSDGKGHPTDDPKVLDDKPPGALQPLGGADAGHKGYGLGLAIEALTGGLGAYGRADTVPGWGASVFVQVLDPEAFGGLAGFRRQLDWLVTACSENPPREGGGKVRLPGQRGLERRRAQLADGVTLHMSILPGLAPWAQRFGLAMPKPR
jgi:L-lactate dehydrogenase